MTAKEYLNQAYWLDRRINSKLEQLSALRDMATKTTSIMSDDVVSRTRNVHSMQDVIAKIIDMQAEVNADIDRLVDLKRDIMQVVKAVDNPELQTLLELRYLCFKSWEYVAEQMGYNVRHIYRLHDEAVEQITIPESCH
jgi:DNA-directed RNA polymerase specialized sigma subunit